VQREHEGCHQHQEQRHAQQEPARPPHAALFEQPRCHFALGCGHHCIRKIAANAAAAAQRRSAGVMCMGSLLLSFRNGPLADRSAGPAAP
jgi:hypothetical protein